MWQMNDIFGDMFDGILDQFNIIRNRVNINGLLLNTMKVCLQLANIVERLSATHYVYLLEYLLWIIPHEPTNQHQQNSKRKKYKKYKSKQFGSSGQTTFTAWQEEECSKVIEELLADDCSFSMEHFLHIQFLINLTEHELTKRKSFVAFLILSLLIRLL